MTALISANVNVEDGEEKGEDELASVKERIVYPIRHATPATVPIGIKEATNATCEGFEKLAELVDGVLQEGGETVYDSEEDEEGRLVPFTAAEREYLEQIKRWYGYCSLLALEMNIALDDIECGDDVPDLPENGLSVRLFTGRRD